MRALGEELRSVRLANPFLLRSFDPPLAELEGRRLVELRRMGKRLVFGLEGEVFMVLHLMIAGRLQWEPSGAKVPKGYGLAALDFESGTLLVTEAGKKRRASLHLVRGDEALRELDPGGLEVLQADPAALREALERENHTLKRVLTDPRVVSGIGNAYSDEILHRAKLSPFKQSRELSDDEWVRLHAAAVSVLREWVDRLSAEARASFPKKVTAFRPEMAVHGRFGLQCPVCGSAIQRIVHADNESDYCPRCQTGGRVLADRALSRLLKDAWPKTIDELEKRGGLDSRRRDG